MKCIVKSTLLTCLGMAAVAYLNNGYAATTSTSASSTASPAEKAKIEQVVHDYLISKPEVLVEAMQVLQGRQMDQAKQSITKTQKDAPRFAKPLFSEANDPFAGNANGKVTVVEFFDYQCPHCVEMGPVLEEVVKSNPDVRIIFKEWPIRGPMSEVAARAALAANKQGKYLALHNALLGANQQLSQDAILTIAKTAGLDVEKLKKDMNDPTTDAQLKANMKLAQDLKLFGTPAFFIGTTNGKGAIAYIPGQMNQQQMQDAITGAGK